MSTAFSKKMQGVATKLLTKYGSTVSLVRAGSKVWDEILGEYIQQPDTSIPLTAVPVPVAGSVAGSRPAHFIDGTTIQAGDMQIICDKKVKPAMGDYVLFKGDTWAVVAISPPTVNDDDIVYFILMRK